MSNSNGAGHRAAARRAVDSPSAMPPLEQVFRRKRILLTGATGFLGKVFLELLLRHHPEVDKVYLLVRGDRRSSLGRFRREILDSPALTPLHEQLGDRFERFVEDKLIIVPGDITNEGLLAPDAEPLERGTIDAVVHSAGLVNFEASLEKAIEVNTTGVANVIEFCRRMGAALLHVSTCYVAGAADGHRFEDDIPENWCPSGRRNFNLEREVKDALAAVARVTAESRDQLRIAELHADAEDDGGEIDSREHALEHRRKQWVEERLKEVGKARAKSWGWPNTYSYTKSLGEQLVLAARKTIPATVVRP
ncbi:MAG TPA: SDR family oxidoreductase, partial [Candidatus Binataceae bacterium]|nr:SDR family oxidoreductase [Candidatus Binataceae bacterium]